MIYNFEDHTYNLTPIEHDDVMPTIAEILNDLKPGQYRTNSDIRNMLKHAYGIQGVTPDRIRVIIHILRVTDQVPLLLASQKGYYTSLDADVIRKYADSLQERIDRINQVRKAIIAQHNNSMVQQTLDLI